MLLFEGSNVHKGKILVASGHEGGRVKNTGKEEAIVIR